MFTESASLFKKRALLLVKAKPLLLQAYGVNNWDEARHPGQSHWAVTSTSLARIAEGRAWVADGWGDRALARHCSQITAEGMSGDGWNGNIFGLFRDGELWDVLSLDNGYA